jgi:hypothetical protein
MTRRCQLMSLVTCGMDYWVMIYISCSYYVLLLLLITLLSEYIFQNHKMQLYGTFGFLHRHYIHAKHKNVNASSVFTPQHTLQKHLPSPQSWNAGAC